MKQLHKSNLWGWSLFNPERDLDFHSVFWRRASGNIVIDPLPLSDHDVVHIEQLGGVSHIIVTNSDHGRAAHALRDRYAARVWGPRLEPAFLASLAAQALEPEHSLGSDLEVIEQHGSKTPGELALLLEGDTLVAGDLIRGQRAGRLNLLPDTKLADKTRALQSLEALACRSEIDAVLVGDGWPVFRGGSAELAELLRRARRD